MPNLLKKSWTVSNFDALSLLSKKKEEKSKEMFSCSLADTIDWSFLTYFDLKKSI